MKVKLEEVERYERHVKMRLAFRFGVITVTEATQAVIRLRVSLADGRSSPLRRLRAPVLFRSPLAQRRRWHR